MNLKHTQLIMVELEQAKASIDKDLDNIEEKDISELIKLNGQKTTKETTEETGEEKTEAQIKEDLEAIKEELKTCTWGFDSKSKNLKFNDKTKCWEVVEN